jgi:hypothetical protein
LVLFFWFYGKYKKAELKTLASIEINATSIFGEKF